MSTDIIGYLYASTVAAGGIMGFVKAGSIPSLAAGLAFGAILGYGAHLTSQDPPKPWVQLGASLVLAGVMGSKWQKSGKLMPAGLICVISCAALIRGLYTYQRQLPFMSGRH